MSAVPADLKPIAPFMARATELATADPVISYWCTYYALQKAMSLGSKDPESNVYLFSLMDKLEATKGDLSGNEAVTDDAAASAYVENFAVKVFAQADNEDRSGKITRTTAKKFLAAANFLELLSVFGEVDTEMTERIKYSKWKAADIAKAFREGRTPVPGPAGGLPPAEEEAPAENTEVTPEEAKELARELSELGTADEQGDAIVSPAQSARSATVPSSTNDEPDSYPFPQHPTTLPSAPPSFDEFPVADEEEQPVTPAFPSFLNTPTTVPGEDGSSSASSDLPLASPSFGGPLSPGADQLPHELPPPTPSILPPTHQTQTLAPPGPHAPSAPPAFPAAVFPSAPPLPPPAPIAASSGPPPLPPAPVAALPTAPTPTELDPMVIAKIQKHAKWAISALNYDDLETARKELRLALDILGG